MLARETALREREDDLANLRDTVITLQRTLSDRTLEIEYMKLWIAKLQRMQFGHKSEKIDHQIEQLELRLEDLQADDGAATVEAPTRPRPEGGKSTGANHFRAISSTSTLFTNPMTHAGRNAGGVLSDLGEDVAEQNLTMFPGIGV